MITRRNILSAATILCSGLSASAEDWKSQYSRLVFAVVPNENAEGTIARYTPLTSYLTKALGVPVALSVAKDYAAVIDGQRARTTHIGFYGAASFAQAVMSGVLLQPIVTQIHNGGSYGYNSVIYVRASSSYKTLDDLKGKTLALVDPNSTSGNHAPRYFLKRAGYDVETFFGKAFYAGSHESAVEALVEGRADAAANLWNAETDTMVTRMAAKGTLKTPEGVLLQPADFRIVFKSDLLPEGPIAMLASLPEELKSKIREALIAFPKADKVAFDKLSDGKDLGLTPVTLKDYQPVIDMLKFNDQQRKKS